MSIFILLSSTFLGGGVPGVTPSIVNSANPKFTGNSVVDICSDKTVDSKPKFTFLPFESVKLYPSV